MSTPLPPNRLDSLTLAIRPDPLVFPPATTAAIAAHWAAATGANPRLFNGSAFLFHRFEVNASSGRLEAEGAPTDYATFLYWRAHREDLKLAHAFPVGAIVTADRKLLVGRMSAHTANAAKLYPPAGSFDASDLVIAADGSRRLDPAANIARELREEIGIDVAELTSAPGWLLFPSNPQAYALVKILRSPQAAAELAPALARHIAADPAEELDDIRFLDSKMRLSATETMPYVNHLLAYLAANE